MKDAYTTAEIAKRMQVTIMTVTRKAKRDNWQSRTRQGRGGGKEWLVEGLPEDVRTAITLHEAKTDVPALPVDNVVIPDWAYTVGMARLRLIIEWRLYIQKSKGSKGAATAAFISAINSSQLLPKEFDIIGEVSDKTLYRWDKKLRDNNNDYRVLCDRRGKWSKGGKKGLGQIGPEAEKIFLGCWLSPSRPSVALSHRAAAAILEKNNQPVPSCQSFRRFAKRFDEANHDLVVLKREGEKALKDTVGPYITRNSELLSVGDVLFCDGHVLNFRCLHPVTGKPFRPTLICWFDWRSHMPVGWEIMPTEDTVAISSALHMSIRMLAQYPRCVYIDNGKAFKSKYFNNIDADFGEFNGLYGRLGIAVQFSKPYEARTKIVERFFRTFDEECQRLLPSYIGNNVANKPAWMQRNEKYHAATHNEWTPTLREASEVFRLYSKWYGQQERRSVGGQRPLDILQGGLGDGVDLADLDRHFLFRQKFMPRRCGFTISGVRFESDALYGLNKPLMAMYSWSDMSEVYLHTLEGERIGVAKPTEALHPMARLFGDELDLQKIKAANKRQRELKAATMKVVKAFDGDIGENAFEQFSWMQRKSVPLKAVPKSKKIEAEPVMDEAEIARLEIVRAKIKQLPTNLPKRPAFFTNELDRYEWCFEQTHRYGYELSLEDQASMSAYEASEEYRNDTGTRFEQLKPIYLKQQSAR
jgi:putative transposase